MPKTIIFANGESIFSINVELISEIRFYKEYENDAICIGFIPYSTQKEIIYVYKTNNKEKDIEIFRNKIYNFLKSEKQSILDLEAKTLRDCDD